MRESMTSDADPTAFYPQMRRPLQFNFSPPALDRQANQTFRENCSLQPH